GGSGSTGRRGSSARTARRGRALHDALPSSRALVHRDRVRRVVGLQVHRGQVELGALVARRGRGDLLRQGGGVGGAVGVGVGGQQDRKSTRLNSSHVKSSYAVFCLKKQRRAR